MKVRVPYPIHKPDTPDKRGRLYVSWDYITGVVNYQNVEFDTSGPPSTNTLSFILTHPKDVGKLFSHIQVDILALYLNNLRVDTIFDLVKISSNTLKVKPVKCEKVLYLSVGGHLCLSGIPLWLPGLEVDKPNILSPRSILPEAMQAVKKFRVLMLHKELERIDRLLLKREDIQLEITKLSNGDEI